MSVGIYIVLLGFVISVIVTPTSGQSPTVCCRQNRNSYTIMALTATLQTGSTLPNILDDFMLVDEDYDVGMQRLQGHLLDQTTGNRQNYTVFNDIKHRRRYDWSSNGTCSSRQLEPIDVLPGPCVPDDFTFAGQYHFRAGGISMPVNIWVGKWQGTLEINYHVADADCSPVALNFYGNNADGSAILLNTYSFADVIQGSVRAADAVTLTDVCKPNGQVVG